MRVVCHAKCFANAQRRGICQALCEKCQDADGHCRFQKATADDTRNYIPVKKKNGLIYFKEVEDDQ